MRTTDEDDIARWEGEGGPPPPDEKPDDKSEQEKE